MEMNQKACTRLSSEEITFSQNTKMEDLWTKNLENNDDTATDLYVGDLK